MSHPISISPSLRNEPSYVTIFYERTYLNIYNVRNPPPLSVKQTEAHDRVDAILACIAQSSEIKQLELHPWFADHVLSDLEHETVIQTNPLKIVAKLDAREKNPDRITINFHLTMHNGTMQQLRAYTDQLYNDYIMIRDAEMMGGELYVFEAVSPDCVGGSGAGLQMSFESPSSKSGNSQQSNGIDPRTLRLEETKAKIRSVKDKPLCFTRRKFSTNKTYENVFGPEASQLEKRIKYFDEHVDEYNRRGIPHKIGVLLHGLPGTGKTSLVGATTNYLQRHLILVKFDQIITASRLRDLFFSENIAVQDSLTGQPRMMKIPISKRIYLLDEIDALGDIVLQRTNTIHGRNDYGMTSSALPDELTLGEILDVFDGNNQNHGRVLFMTSNHPEKLDRALLRPGRIDVNLKFGKATKDTIQNAFEYFYNLTEHPFSFDAFAEQKLTMAEVHSVLMNHYDDMNIAFQELIALACPSLQLQSLKIAPKKRKIEHCATEVVFD